MRKSTAHRLAKLADRIEVQTDPRVLESYRFDESNRSMTEAGLPLAVVHPQAVKDIQEVVHIGESEGVPIVPRGSGSGLSGGANAIDGGITLCFDRMNRIAEIDEDSLLARVDPGVINGELKELARAVQLDYTPDPASYEFSTLGGNISTNAGGLCCVKYGVTRESVLAIDLVTGSGELVALGSHTRKSVTGFDLVSLICGSEGTLGIVVGATLRLIPIRSSPATMVASFDSASDAGRAAAKIRRTLVPSMLEFMDRTSISAVEAMAPQGLSDEVGAMLFAQSDVGIGSLSEVEAMAQICDETDASLVFVTESLEEGRMAMSARKMAFPALSRLGLAVLDDVCVPIGRIAELLSGCERIGERAGVTIGTFGHAGDGNFHPTLVVDRDDEDGLLRVRRAFEAIVEMTLSLGGTITGEHGVGLLKRRWLHDELGPAHDLHRRIKEALDPGQILNPGKNIG